MDDDNFGDVLLSTIKLRVYENGSMKNGKGMYLSRIIDYLLIQSNPALY